MSVGAFYRYRPVVERRGGHLARRSGPGGGRAAYAEYRRLRRTRVVLATAHLDHDPSNSWPRNLRALC